MTERYRGSSYTVAIPWQEFGAGLGVKVECPPREDLLSACDEQAKRWTADFEKTEGIELTEDERAEIADALRFMQSQHWSEANVFGVHINIDELIEIVNLSCRESIGGDGIVDWSDEDSAAVTFVLEPPILGAYEDARLAHQSRPPREDITLRTFTAENLLFTMKTAWLRAGREPMTLHLLDWDRDREPPTYKELSRIVESRRRRTRRSRSERTET